MNPTPSQPMPEHEPEPLNQDYVPVTIGSIVQDGDEFFNFVTGKWTKTIRAGSEVRDTQYYRRRVATRTAPEAVAGERIGVWTDPQSLGHKTMTCPKCSKIMPAISPDRCCQGCGWSDEGYFAPTPPVEADKDAEERSEAEAHAYNKGREDALSGIQEVVTNPDGNPFQEWDEMKPLIRIRFYEDSGDRDTGIPASAFWVNADEQAGTIIGDILADLTTARATIAKLEEDSANKEATIRACGESRENLRATIAERDAELERLRDAKNARISKLEFQLAQKSDALETLQLTEEIRTHERDEWKDKAVASESSIDERDKRIEKLEGALRFIRDECDWEQGDSDQPFGGGDDRIGPSCTAALAHAAEGKEQA